MSDILNRIRQTLIESSNEKTRKQSEYFFKEKVTFYGVRSATIQKISKEFFAEIKDKPKAEIFAACEKLWQSGYMEESFVACDWSERLTKKFEPSDFEILERWIKNYVNNWASCDSLCNHTVGDFVMSKKAVMPRTALRYAIEKMPDELKKQAMIK